MNPWICFVMLGSMLQLSKASKYYDVKEMQNATELRLESRQINMLNDDEFTPLPSLTHLYLSDNRLKKLNVISSSLLYLNVKNNKIQNIDDSSFENLPSLEEIYLSENNIGEINWDLDKMKSNIFRIDLSNNKNLRSVKIKSTTLDILELSGDNIVVLELDAPNLQLLDLQYGKVSNGDLTNICRKHPKMTFNISYINESNDLQQLECLKSVAESTTTKLRSMNIQKLETQTEISRRKLVGCEYSTLRANVSDVVLNPDSYYKLNIIFVSLIGVIMTNCIIMIWLTRKLLLINSKSRNDYYDLRVLEAKKKFINNSSYK